MHNMDLMNSIKKKEITGENFLDYWNMFSSFIMTQNLCSPFSELHLIWW